MLIDLLERWREQGGSGESVSRLARTRQKLGGAFTSPGRYGQARGQLERRLKEIEAEGEGDHDTLRLRAESYHLLGEMYDRSNRRREAIDAYWKSIEIRERLVEADPESHKCREDLARGHGYLGDTYLEINELDDAWTAYQAAERHRKWVVDRLRREGQSPAELAGESPEAVTPVWQLARSTFNEALYRVRKGEVDRAIEAIRALRGWRESLDIRPGLEVEGVLQADGYGSTSGLVARMARFAFSENGGEPAATVPIPGGAVGILPSEGVDLCAAERKRDAERGRLEGEIARSEGKLANQGFVAKAPEQVVQGERDKLEKLKKELEELS